MLKQKSTLILDVWNLFVQCCACVFDSNFDSHFIFEFRSLCAERFKNLTQTKDVTPVTNFRRNFQNLAIMADALQNTQNLIMLFLEIEDGKETYKQRLMHVRNLVLLIKSFVWWRSQCGVRCAKLKLPNKKKNK